MPSKTALGAASQWPAASSLAAEAPQPDQFCPVAHVCFHSLDVPDYSSYETFRGKLKSALLEIDLNKSFTIE